VKITWGFIRHPGCLYIFGDLILVNIGCATKKEKHHENKTFSKAIPDRLYHRDDGHLWSALEGNS
jgi:hypothetical protein